MSEREAITLSMCEIENLIRDERENIGIDESSARSMRAKGKIIAYETALKALRAQQEQSNPQPLTSYQIEALVGKPVWYQPTDKRDGAYGWKVIWGASENTISFCGSGSVLKEDLGVKFNLYANEPKGEHHG